jgi:hypothetical protein
MSKSRKGNILLRKCWLLLMLSLIPMITFGQVDPPADGCDPYDGCTLPLDTWVFVLVIAAIIFGVHKLQQKQKALTV